jgi:hypothetical protein
MSARSRARSWAALRSSPGRGSLAKSRIHFPAHEHLDHALVIRFHVASPPRPFAVPRPLRRSWPSFARTGAVPHACVS